MSIVKLSTGEEAYFKDRFTHGDELVYSAGLRKGVLERRTVTSDGSVVVELSPDNVGAAFEDTLLVVIEKVKRGEEEVRPTLEWLRGLLEPDYEELAKSLLELRRKTWEAAAAGKKNRG